MSTYTDIFDGVVAWTNRPSLVAETNLAIRQAVRTAHRAGTFPKDLCTLPLTVSTDQVQQIDLSSVAPDLRAIARVFPTDLDYEYKEVQVLDLFDNDGYARTDVFWLIGTNLMVRAAAPYSALSISYYRHPVLAPIENLSSWIAIEHQDLIILWAAATVLTFIGEQEIKTRVEQLAGGALRDLVSDSLFITAR
jgi:hypothetical protein